MSSTKVRSGNRFSSPRAEFMIPLGPQVPPKSLIRNGRIDVAITDDDGAAVDGRTNQRCGMFGTSGCEQQRLSPGVETRNSQGPTPGIGSPPRPVFHPARESPLLRDLERPRRLPQYATCVDLPAPSPPSNTMNSPLEVTITRLPSHSTVGETVADPAEPTDWAFAAAFFAVAFLAGAFFAAFFAGAFLAAFFARFLGGPAARRSPTTPSALERDLLGIVGATQRCVCFAIGHVVGAEAPLLESDHRLRRWVFADLFAGQRSGGHAVSAEPAMRAHRADRSTRCSVRQEANAIPCSTSRKGRSDHCGQRHPSLSSGC